MSDEVHTLDGFSVARVEGEGLCIVSESGSYWHLFDDAVMQAKGDELAVAYQQS